MLILPGDRLPSAQPLDRPQRGRVPDRTRPRSWLYQLRIASAGPVDGPRICPPAIPGQLLLFRMRRQLTDAHARRIKDRELAGYERLMEAAVALAAERSLTTSWWRGTCLMLRLALAVREADGGGRITREALDDLPRFRNAAADVLRHAGLTRAGTLPPRPRGSLAVIPVSPQRSCEYCDSWGTRKTCSSCGSWRHQGHPADDCTRCGRRGIPLLDGLCRACCLHIDQHGPETRAQPWTQLWFGGDLAPRLVVKSGTLGYAAPQQKARARAAARRAAAPPVSPHLAVPGQGVLFDARRDWSCIAVGSLDQLPSLTPAAKALLAEFREHARARGWEEEVRRLAARSLRIVLAWIGADAPIREADIRGIPADRPGTSARRMIRVPGQPGPARPRPGPRGRPPRAGHRAPPPQAPRRDRRRAPPLGAGAAGRGPPPPRADGPRDDPQVPQLPLSRPGGLVRTSREPAGDHPRRHPARAEAAAGPAGPGPGHRPAQPVSARSSRNAWSSGTLPAGSP